MPDWLTLVVVFLLMVLAAAGIGLSGAVLSIAIRGRCPSGKRDDG